MIDEFLPVGGGGWTRPCVISSYVVLNSFRGTSIRQLSRSGFLLGSSAGKGGSEAVWLLRCARRWADERSSARSHGRRFLFSVLNSCKHMCFLKGAETIEIDRAQFQPLIDSGEVEKTLKKWKKTRFLMGASIVREGSQPDKMEGILTFLSRSRI